ncbi:MAG: hypothetical protein ACYDEX_07340 [Mobilitalea sp.]
MKETKLYRTLSLVHLIFVTSFFLGITTIASGGILLLPALTAVFYVGRDLLFGRYNVHDGLLKRLISEVRHHMRMLRFLPAEILFVMQCVGIYVASLQKMQLLQILLLAAAAFLLVFLNYVCCFEVFFGGSYTWISVIIAMFYKVSYLFSLWILAILGILFMQPNAIKYLFVAGSAIVLSIEIIIFLALMAYKEVLGISLPDDEEEKPEWYKKMGSTLQ